MFILYNGSKNALSFISDFSHVDGAFDFELSQISGNRKGVKGNNSPSSFKKKDVNNFHNTVFYSLFRNTNYLPN